MPMPVDLPCPASQSGAAAQPGSNRRSPGVRAGMYVHVWICPPGPYLDLYRAQRVVELNVALHVVLIYYKTHTIHITAGRSKRYALRYYSRVRAFRVLHTQSLLITLGPDPTTARLPVGRHVTPPGGPPAPPRPMYSPHTQAASNTARACSATSQTKVRGHRRAPALVRVRRHLTLTVEPRMKALQAQVPPGI